MAATIKIEVAGREVFIEPHDKPVHLDEFVAAFLIEEFGDERFVQKYAKKGVIRVGVGGGEFDEHPTSTTPRKEGECAATLVAKALGVEKEPGLKRILDFTLSRDLKGGGHPFDLSALAKLSSECGDSPQKTYKWVRKILEDIYDRDSEFEETAGPEYRRVAREEVIQVGARRLKIVVLPSNNVLVRKFALSPARGGAALVIQKWSSGHVQIFSQMRLIPNLDDVAWMIRLAEQQAKGQNLSIGFNKLASEGKVPGVEEWWYHKAGAALLNGRSPDNWGVPPTKLPLEQIKRIVQIGIDPFYLPQHCRTSRNCIFKECGWHSWGLNRCQNIRRG